MIHKDAKEDVLTVADSSAQNDVKQICLDLPAWAWQEMAALPSHLPTLEARMAAVIHFARFNTRHASGGPFAAGVFERDSGKVVMLAVNRVVPLGCSCAHAEVMAISLAQQRLGSFDLGAAELSAHELVVNWMPCAMCFGALLWSGIRSLVVAGYGPEMEEVTGFDEGPLPPNWQEELNRRGISFTGNVLREQSLAAFREFAASGAPVYNARQGAVS